MEYKIFGDVTEIYVKILNTQLTVLIDTDDLDKILTYSRIEVGNGYGYKPFYAYLYKNSKFYSLHSVVSKPKKGKVIDHINGNTLDNRKSNLRHLTIQENCLNRKNLNRNNTSGYRNVQKDKNRWKVCLKVNGFQYRKVGFKTPEEANEYAIKLRKEFGIE